MEFRVPRNTFQETQRSHKKCEPQTRKNQYAHFDLDINIEVDKLQKALNSLLPDDIYVKDVKEVDDEFHARFNAIGKEYIYKINY